jgi:hypothetical protein
MTRQHGHEREAARGRSALGRLASGDLSKASFFFYHGRDRTTEKRQQVGAVRALPPHRRLWSLDRRECRGCSSCASCSRREDEDGRRLKCCSSSSLSSSSSPPA